MMLKNSFGFIEKYYNAILENEVIVCEWTKLVYQRIINDLKNGEYFFDDKKETLAINFIENFVHHTKGSERLLKLELWQKALISCIFSLVDKKGLRQFQEVFILIARKNGKTLLASAIMSYVAFLSDEYGKEIYCVAPKLEQALFTFENFYVSVSKEPDLDLLIKKRRSDIYIESTNTKIKPIAFSSKKSDGYNISLVTCDEISSWEGENGLKQYQVLKSSFGAKEEPLLIGITTSGYINNGIFDDLMIRAMAFLKGASNEKRFLPFLYMIENVEKCFEIEELKKSNPNLNVSVKENFLLDEAEIAKISPSTRVEFLTKYCNIKQNRSIAWLDFQTVAKAVHQKTIKDFERHYAIGGVDLSQTTDLTSACVVIEKEGIEYIFSHFWIPKNRLEFLEENDKTPYSIFIKKGWLSLSGENYIDYKDISNWFLKLRKEHKIFITIIGYDKYCARYFIDELENNGFLVDDVRQGSNLTPLIKKFEGGLKDENILIEDNELLKQNILNTGLKLEEEGRKMRIIKTGFNTRIDGMAAILDALTVKDKHSESYKIMLENKGR